MNTRIQTSADSEISKGAYKSVCTELISDALPKVENSSQSENSDTGVSTHFVPLHKDILVSRRVVLQPHWYALRVTYGREKISPYIHTLDRGMRVLLLMAFLCFGFCSLYAHQSKSSTKVEKYGIDVSRHNGKIDWAKVAKDKNIVFVYIKATTGATHVDDCYKTNIKEARKNGLKVGSYHFFTSYSSAHAQFENFKKQAKRSEQDIIPMVDVESELGKWTHKQIQDSLLVFMRLCKAYYGAYPMVYGSQHSYNTYCAPRFNNFHLMIAKYNGVAPIIIGEGHYSLWQYTEKGKVNGINHPVDKSRFHKDYNIKNITLPASKKKKNKSQKKK